MPITDNRTLLDAADALTNWVEDDGGTMNLALNTARIQGTNAVAQQVSAARAGTLYDFGAATDVSDNVFYLWWNVTTANLLQTFASAGVTIRFCGATITDWFEITIAGSDTYSGGWTMSVVDIEEARRFATSSPTNNNAATNGTPPATTAIQYVGVVWDISGMIPGTDPNCFVDAFWRLPVGTPGIIVSGENDAVSPIRPWAWDDIVDAGDVGDVNKAWGTITKNDGVIKLNTPIQFGANGSPSIDHDFEDTLVVGAWESQVVRDGFYGWTIVGDNTNTQRFVAGVSGLGGQGWTFVAETPDGPRWFIEATDVDIDLAGFYGCRFDHTTIIDIDNPLVDMFDSLLIDGQRLYHSTVASPRGGADFQRNSIINAVPIYGDSSPAAIESPANRAYLWTADPNKIIDNTFNYFESHAIRIENWQTGAGNLGFVGNVFDGPWLEGNSPAGEQTLEAGLWVVGGGLVMDISGGGNTPTVFDTGSPITVLNNNIQVTITNIQPGTEVRVFPDESPINTTAIAGIESTGSPSEFSFSGAAGLAVRIVVFNIDYVLPPANEIQFIIPNSDTSFPITQIIDRNYLNP
jgi:hypothetical protein